MDLTGIRFHTTRLCGGQDLLLTPDRPVPMDLDRVHRETRSRYVKTPGAARFDWNGIMVTMYPAGSLLFGFFNDRPKAEEYALRILSELARDEDAERFGGVPERIRFRSGPRPL